MKTDPIFGLSYPTSCHEVPDEILNPKNSWKDKKSYDAKASHLADLFKKNFKTFEKDVSSEIIKGGPVS